MSLSPKNLLSAITFPKRKPQGAFFATLPKSGTDFIDNTLMAVADLKLPKVYRDANTLAEVTSGSYSFEKPLIGVGNFDAQFLNSKYLEISRIRGDLVSTHASASFFNIKAFEKARIDRLTVVMRDPRDATVSLLHQISKGGQRQRNAIMEFLFLPLDYFDWPKNLQLSHLVRTFLPKAISWIESWFANLERPITAINVNLQFHDELRQSSHDFIQQIISHHNILNADLSSLPDKRQLGHFRSGESRQYLSEFSQSDLEFSDRLIGDRITTAYRRAAKANFKRVASEAYTGDAFTQAYLAARCFPNDLFVAERTCEIFTQKHLGKATALKADWMDWITEANREPLDYPRDIINRLKGFR